jgi:hypothetical protein
MVFLDFDGPARLYDERVVLFALAEQFALSLLGRAGCFGGFARAAVGGEFGGCLAEEILRDGPLEAAKVGIDEDIKALPVLVENTDRELIEEQMGQRFGVWQQLAKRICFPQGGLDCISCIHGTFKGAPDVKIRCLFAYRQIGGTTETFL